jgi:hypothetical protein
MATDDVDQETEEDYLTSDDATEVWCIVRDWANFNRWLNEPRDQSMNDNHRLLYLLTVAVLRRVEHLVEDADWRKLLAVTEAYAEGEAASDQFSDAHDDALCGPTSHLPAATGAAIDAIHFLPDDYKVIEGIELVFDAAGYLAAVEAGELAADAPLSVAESVWKSPAFLAGKAKEERAICGLIRDVIGNPFRSLPVIAPEWLAWNNGVIPALARSIYGDRAFDQLPVLGDALEDAGCTDRVLLDHCHEPGGHVRGCWVLDLLLGKQ